ncbi:MAG TPA: protein kinase, partial [Planctomycetota bacterium]|nr:protein kinase [Planctomycetota bacterium]
MLIPANEDGAPAPANQAEALLLECLRAGIGLSAQFADLQARGSPDARRTAKLLALLDEVGFLHEPGAVDPRLPERIGDYRVLAHLGSGGMGVVYLAEHVQLRRRVAVKVIHRDLAATDKARERFRREALAASRLDHPGICTIYEVGTDGEQPFLALRYVPGRDLAECLAEARARSQTMVALTDDGPLLPAILRYFEQAAQALHTAHEAGLVHRDVKPGNLMVTTRGEPVLLDFGLARFDDGTDAPNLTLSGDRLGTPAYMAPELVAGLSVDRRTDVYALGATLYEAVTLQAPYSAPTREALYRRILVGDVSRASRHNRAVPRDLEIVLATALDRDPDHRYRTAADLAEDLRRLRESLPILARRPGPLVRMQRFAQRNPVIATLLVGLLLAAGVLTWMWKQRGDALQQREAALGSARAVELALRANDGRMGPVPSLAAAIEAVEKEQNVDTLSALYAATLRSHEAARLEHDHLPTALLGNAVQFSPQGDLVLTACYDGSARLWNRAGQRVAVMFHEGLVNGAVFSPSGDRVLTAGMDGTAAVWDRSGQRLFTLPHGLGYGEVGWTDPQLHCVVWADYSPDGRRIATGCSDRRVLFWDPATGERVGAELTLHRGPPMRHAWSRDSTLLASAESDAGLDIGLAPAQVLVWRTDAPHALAVPPLMHPRAVYSVAFAPDGSRLLTACGDGHLRVFELSTGQVETEIELGGMVMQADFSADGERLLACSTNGVAGLWSRTGELLQRRNFDRTPWLRFAAGDQILGTCFANAVLRLDDELREVQVCVGHTHLCSHVALSPDGRQMVSISQDMTARLWSVIDPDMPRLIGHRSRVSGLAKLADGSILSTSSDGTRIWDLHGQQLRSLDTGDCGQGWGFALDDTRQRLAVASGGIARVYDVATGRPLFSAPAPGLHMHVHLGGVSATWLADGRLAVGGGSSPDISVHAADGRT